MKRWAILTTDKTPPTGDANDLRNAALCLSSGYDGGDCCECTCVSTAFFTCGSEDYGGFACVDPSAPCVDDDDFIPGGDDFLFDYDDDLFSSSFTFEPCIDDFIADGDCDSTNNNEECGGSKVFSYIPGRASLILNCFPLMPA